MPLLSWALLAAASAAPAGDLQSSIEEFQADLGSLSRYYGFPNSDAARKRFDELYADREAWLGKVDSTKLDSAGKIDYALFRNELQLRRRRLVTEGKVQAGLRKVAPFADRIIALEEKRVRMEPVDPAVSAKEITDLAAAVRTAQAELQAAPSTDAYGLRADGMMNELRRGIRRWFDYYNGYDPQFGWWVKAPFAELEEALGAYHGVVKTKTLGKPGTIPGYAVGRAALLDDLASEMIPYSPEELIAIADREYAWCLAEMKKASAQMGFGDDWKAALEAVKQKFVPPGEQPAMIRKLALEAIDYVESKNLVTVPPLAKESWRMSMMSPERQLVSPFFLGGETILVSYPTDTMTHDQKLMSMRGNNPYFSRATVQHELIPGHHLQGFMSDRHRPYRQLFSTPFLVEGWALYWEMLLWDMGFPKTPEEKVGMLFWRMHRCTRITFSLGFHLGQLTPEQCVDMLVDRVGHERANAEGEVRRSFNGSYPPLYQAAYLLGGLQIRALRKELVDTKKMTDRQFHDAILKENSIPVTLIRASLLGKPPEKGSVAPWAFAGTP